MKKIICVMLVALVLLTGCGTETEHIAPVSTAVMGAELTVPETSDFARAVFEATEVTLNTVVNEYMGKKPEFIAFEFSGDLMLSQTERKQLIDAFSVYGVEISEGLRSGLTDIDRGVTIGYDSIERIQTSDCDLTVPVKVYYGKNIYTYCSDFKFEKGEYVLFRLEMLNRTRYQW